MKTFLKDYWLWIVVPMALVLAGLAALVLLGGSEGSSPFHYNVYG